MFIWHAITNKSNTDDDKKWPYTMLIIGPSGSEKTNVLLNLIQKQDNDSLIDKIYLYAKDLREPKYKFLIKKGKDIGITNSDDPSAFIEYANSLDYVYSNINDYNPKRKRKILIVFDDMNADIMTNEKFQTLIKKLFFRCRKLNISLVFITQSFFKFPKDVRLNSTHYLITKIHNRRQLQNIAIDHSACIDYQDFMKIYRNCAREPYYFPTIDTRLHANNLMRFVKNF